MKEDQNDIKIERRSAWKLAAYMLGTILISALMLGFNAGLVFALFHGVHEYIPAFTGNLNVVQWFIFVTPIVLLCLEWHAWDILTARPIRNN